MLKKVLSVVLALVLAMGVLFVATSAASAADLQAALNALPNEYNAQFYNESTQAAILEARAAAQAALAGEDAGAINDAYALCKSASDLAKATESRYIEEDDEYIDYFVNRDESRAVATIYLESNAPEYLKAGDTFDVTVSLDVNFIIRTMNLGFAYDKTKFEFVSDSYPSVKGLDLTSSQIMPDWAHNANGREKDGGFPDSWTKEMKDQYNIICKMIGYDAYDTEFASLDGKTLLMTLTFRVKENVEDGEALMFLDHDFQATFENNIMGYYALPAIKFTRAYGSLKDSMVADHKGVQKSVRNVADQQATVDQTVNFETETLTFNIGEAPVPADYSALDAAIAAKSQYVQDEYTEESWAAYANAIAAGEACDRNLTADDQGTIDALTAAINNAAAALEFKKVENCVIKSVTPVGKVRGASYTTLDVVVEGNPWKLSVVDPAGNTNTLTREHKNTLSITDNGNGTETWRVIVFTRTVDDNYQAFARYYDLGWVEPGFKFKLESTPVDKAVYSYEIAGAYKGAIYLGYNTVTVKTGLDVTKVQFAIGSSTATYASGYEDVDGVRVWTINHNFAKVGDFSYDIRVRTANTTFENSDKTIDVTVVI